MSSIFLDNISRIFKSALDNLSPEIVSEENDSSRFEHSGTCVFNIEPFKRNSAA